MPKAYRERTPRRALQHALIDAEMRQQELCRRTRIEKSTMSRIISGEYNGTPSQRKAIARVLLRPIEDLFPESHVWPS